MSSNEEIFASIPLSGNFAIDLLIEKNIGLIVNEAKKFSPNLVSDINDYIQAGLIGLVRAINEYSPDYKTKFSTCAVPYIKNYILKEYNKFATQDPESKKIKDKRKISTVYLKDWENKLQVQPVLPKEIEEMLEESNLTEKEIIILKLYYVDDKTVTEIGKLYNLHHSSISRLIKKALKKLDKCI